METYQPRAWTMGYLFDPEPPTPYCDGKPSEETDQFKAMRDAVGYNLEAALSALFSIVRTIFSRSESDPDPI
ncbi:unnamed protein product [Cylicostephanus goldi]|uniref:Uncharacterized protein n=1 Tax=Cylicostephanus goldi TaxID=71465 RepID=A0A3P6SR75_CYLGO|nr:unnamed protein product [Cylicostephanus goldi]